MSRALTAWGFERARYARTNCGGLYPASIKRYERFLSVSLPLLCHSARISSLINHTEADGRSLLAASSRFCLSFSVESRATFTRLTEHVPRKNSWITAEQEQKWLKGEVQHFGECVHSTSCCCSVILTDMRVNVWFPKAPNTKHRDLLTVNTSQYD